MYSNITDESIKEYALKQGYDKYIPYDLVRDIIQCHHYEYIYGRYRSHVDIKMGYKRDLIDLLDSIHIDTSISSIKFAINVLKRISTYVDLRNIKDTITFEDTKQLNYDVDLRDYNDTIKELLEIDNTTYNTKEIDSDILDILRNTTGMIIGKGFNPIKTKSYKRMPTYSSVLKVSPTKRCMPHFDYKFAKKEIYIKDNDTDYVSKTEKILAIDISASHGEDGVRNYLYMGAIILSPLFSNPEFRLKLILFGYDIYYTYDVTDIQQFKKICESKHFDPLRKKTWNQTEDKIFNTFNNKEILIISDGTEHFIRADKWKNNIINAITTRPNMELNNLCKVTNGKYFQFKCRAS